MALGDAGNQNKKYPDNDYTYYSRLKITNNTTKLRLTFPYWKGMLKFAVSIEKPGENYPTYEEIAYVHLSPMKAMILRKELERFMNADPTNITEAYGVETGISEVRTICVFKYMQESTAQSPLREMIIGKIDPNGNLVQCQEFPFNQASYNYGCEWDNFNDLSTIRKYPHKNTELDMLDIVLEEYIRSANGAMAYSVIDMKRFDNSSLINKIGKLMEACGVGDTEKKKYNNNKGNNSYFDSAAMNPPEDPPLTKENSYDDISALF